MKRVGVAELKNHLSSHLRAVEAGGEVEVTDRNRAIARILPVGAGSRVSVRPPRRPFASIRDKAYPPAGWSASSKELLLEDRQAR